MKKIISGLTAALLAVAVTVAAPVYSFAAEAGDMSFRFSLTADGGTSAAVEPGNDVEIRAELDRADSEEDFPMYAMQYDIWYDSDIFELVTDSVQSGKKDIRVSVTSLNGSRDGWSCVSASAYSSSESGDEWSASETVVTFKLRALKVGSANVMSRSCSVSRSDGMSGYDVSANDVNVTVRTKAQQNGGSSGSGSGSGASGGGSTGTPAGGSSGASGSTQPGDNSAAAQPGESSGSAQSASARFDDVAAGAWYESAVSYALEKGLFSGTSERTFSPDGNMTRAMLVTVLWRMDGSSESAAGAAGFDDVAAGRWYTDAVAWASSNGIVTGYGDGRFGVNDSVTRQQLAAILYRYASLKGADVSASSDISVYADHDKTASWAKAPVSWAVAKGIINGTSRGRLAPAGTATRAQAASILMRFADV